MSRAARSAATVWVRDSLFSIIEQGPRRSARTTSGVGGLDARTLADIGLEDHRMSHQYRDGMIDRCWF